MTKRKPLSKRLTILSRARNLTSRQEHQLVAAADRARHLEADRLDLSERVSLARMRIEEHHTSSLYGALGLCLCGICEIGRILNGPDQMDTEDVQ